MARVLDQAHDDGRVARGTSLGASMTKQLRIWWIPQVPMTPFYVPVSSVEEGVKIMDVLANYDIFQFEHRVKGDYANTGGLEMIEGCEWVDWCTEDGYDDPRAWLEEQVR